MTGSRGGLPKSVFLVGAISAILGGLLPLALSFIGIRGYLRRGYLRSKAGDPIDPGWATWVGFVWYGIMILGGVALIRWGLGLYRNRVGTE